MLSPEWEISPLKVKCADNPGCDEFAAVEKQNHDSHLEDGES